MKTIIRDSIKQAAKDLREIRRNKSCSILLGAGYTIAIAGSFCSIRPMDSNTAYNFTASWNHGSIFWSEKSASIKLNKLREQRPELKLEVVHQNDLRDRHEKHCLFVLQAFFNIRNKA